MRNRSAANRAASSRPSARISSRMFLSSLGSLGRRRIFSSCSVASIFFSRRRPPGGPFRGMSPSASWRAPPPLRGPVSASEAGVSGHDLGQFGVLAGDLLVALLVLQTSGLARSASSRSNLSTTSDKSSNIFREPSFRFQRLRWPGLLEAIRAISIWSSDGSRVVSFWTHRPGRMASLSSQLFMWRLA